MKKTFLLLMSHAVVGFAGFSLGIYLLPILIAPAGPTQSQMNTATETVVFSGEFTKDLPGSDFFHWGEGKISVGREQIAFSGKLAPGPDYKLYLSPVFVDDEASFKANRANMVQVADIKTFNGFVADLPNNVVIDNYTTAIVWCETFSEFISAAKYQ